MLAHYLKFSYCPIMKKISIKYFASLKEQAGKNEEEVETKAECPKELYQEIQEKYCLSPKITIKKSMHIW